MGFTLFTGPLSLSPLSNGTSGIKINRQSPTQSFLLSLPSPFFVVVVVMKPKTKLAEDWNTIPYMQWHIGDGILQWGPKKVSMKYERH